MSDSPRTDGKKWHPVPPMYLPPQLSTGTLTGVWLAEDEEVEWHTWLTHDGQMRATGYTIKPKSK